MTLLSKILVRASSPARNGLKKNGAGTFKHLRLLIASFRRLLQPKVIVFCALSAILTNGRAMTVDVSAQWEYWSYHYSPIHFSEGTYRITLTGTVDNGAYNAWNAWGPGETFGCNEFGLCERGYLNSYSFGYIKDHDFIHEIATVGGSVIDRTAQAYSDPWLALQNAYSYVFDLAEATLLYFYVKDGEGSYYDNSGGVSLSIQAMPAPATLTLFLTAFGFLFFANFFRNRL